MTARQLLCAAPGCGKTFEGKRPNSKYCSDTCRKRGQRSPGGAAAVPAARPAARAPRRRKTQVAAKTRQELMKARRLSTSDGELALVLAEQIDQGGEGGAALAALSREYAAAKERALKNAKSHDPAQKLIDKADQKIAAMDEVGERRERRTAGAR